VALVASPPAATRHPVAAAAPASAAVVASKSPAPAAAPPPSAASLATITFSLPTEPVPKNQLGMPQPELQIVAAPLNPAQIPLPPSVATALQSMNQKTSKPTMLALAAPPPPAATAAAVKPETVTQLVAGGGGGHLVKQVQAVVEGGEGNQLTFASGSLPPGFAAAGLNASTPLFYYFMPGAVPQYVAADGGPATVQVRVSTAEGGTAQLVTLPAGAIQASSVLPPSTQANFPPVGQWILEASGQSGGGVSGSGSGRSSAI